MLEMCLRARLHISSTSQVPLKRISSAGVLACEEYSQCVLAFSVLICVLVFRLPIDRWLRALVGTCAIATCVCTLAASAATGGALHGFSAARSSVILNGSPYYMLGHLPPGGYVLASFAKQRGYEQASDFENTRLVVFLQDLATPEYSLQLTYEQMNLWDQITSAAKVPLNLDRTGQ